MKARQDKEAPPQKHIFREELSSRWVPKGCSGAVYFAPTSAITSWTFLIRLPVSRQVLRACGPISCWGTRWTSPLHLPTAYQPTAIPTGHVLKLNSAPGNYPKNLPISCLIAQAHTFAPPSAQPQPSNLHCPPGSHPSLKQPSPAVWSHPTVTQRQGTGDRGQLKASPQNLCVKGFMTRNRCLRRKNASLALENTLSRRHQDEKFFKQNGIFWTLNTTIWQTRCVYLQLCSWTWRRSSTKPLCNPTPLKNPNTRVIEPALSKPDFLMQWYFSIYPISLQNSHLHTSLETKQNKEKITGFGVRGNAFCTSCFGRSFH